MIIQTRELPPCDYGDASHGVPTRIATDTGEVLCNRCARDQYSDPLTDTVPLTYRTYRAYAATRPEYSTIVKA
jgi:hypothetical protein